MSDNLKDSAHSTQSHQFRASKYYDVDSTYRNRNNYFNPCDFVIPVSFASKGSTSQTFVDPVLGSAPFTGSTKAVGNNFTQASPVASVSNPPFLDPPYQAYVQNQVVALDIDEPAIENFYIGTTLQMFGQFHGILAYNGQNKYAIVDTPFIPPSSADIPSGTQYFIIKVPSYFSSNISVPSFNHSTLAVSSVNLLNRSPSERSNFYAGDYMIFSNGPNSGDIVLIDSYNPQPNTTTYTQPSNPGSCVILSTITEQGFLFTPTESGVLQEIDITMTIFDANTSQRVIQFTIYQGAGIPTATQLANNPTMRLYQGDFPVPNELTAVSLAFGVPVNSIYINHNQYYTVSLLDVSPGGISTGYSYLYGKTADKVNYVAYNTTIYPQLDIVATPIGSLTWKQPANPGVASYISTTLQQQYLFTPTNSGPLAYLDLTLVAFEAVSSGRELEIGIYFGDGIRGTQIALGAAIIANTPTPTSTRFSISSTESFVAVMIPPSVTTFSDNNSWIVYNNTAPLLIGPGNSYPPTVVYTPSFTLPPDIYGVISCEVIIHGTANIDPIPANTFLFLVYDHDTKMNLGYDVDVVGSKTNLVNGLTFTFNNNTQLHSNQKIDIVLYITQNGYNITNLNYEFFFSYINSTGTIVQLVGGTPYTLSMIDITSGGTGTGYINVYGITTPNNPYFTVNTTVYPQLDLISVNNTILWKQPTNNVNTQRVLLGGDAYGFIPTQTGTLTSIVVTITSFDSMYSGRTFVIQIMDAGLITVLYNTSVVIPNAPVATTYLFTLPNPIIVTASTQYYFIFGDLTLGGNNTGGIYAYGIQQNATYPTFNGSIYPQLSAYVSNPVNEFQQPDNLNNTEILVFNTQYGYQFTPAISGYITKIGVELTSFDISGNRTIQIQIYEGAGFGGTTVLPTSPPITVNVFNTTSKTLFTLGFDLTSAAPLLVAGQIYTFSMIDITSTGTSSGRIVVFGIIANSTYITNTGSIYPSTIYYMPSFNLTFSPPRALSSFLNNNTDLVQFSTTAHENATTLYFGGGLNATKSSFYSIKLINLIMPNQVLNIANGGALDSYPYVYVIFTNEGSRGVLNTLISNNPNSSTALFKVFIDRSLYDIPTYFFTLEGPPYEQIISFRPDQDVRFTVTLPSGEPVSFQTQENQSPEYLNPLIQVNAVFQIRQLENYQSGSFGN